MSKTADKRARMQQQIIRHGKNINAIFGADYDPEFICKKLFRMENRLHKAALMACNEAGHEDQYKRVKASVLKAIHILFGNKIPLEVNPDPRGYQLKIPDSYVYEHNLQIHRDFGGYGILATNYNED